MLDAARLVCHCLLVETNDGLVLVDTGFGLDDVRGGRARIGLLLTSIARPRFDPDETAIRQVERLGYEPTDVRHIVLTHLDVDHAGGLADFPSAKVHVMAKEHEAAVVRPLGREAMRYRSVQWAHGPHWVTHVVDGERWLGFERVRVLEAIDPEIALVPLYGHSRGHAGVAVRAPDGWLFHAGDAYFHRGEVEERDHCPPGLALFQGIVQAERAARLANRERVRELALAHARDVHVFCAHDAVELERMQESARSVPAETPPAHEIAS